MRAIEITGIVFAIIMAGVFAGVYFARRLPEHHVTSDSRDLIKLGMAMIATLSALVLGVLIGTTKGIYDTQSEEVRQLASKLLLLDRLLSLYGPETEAMRHLLQDAGADTLERLWPEATEGRADLTPEELARPLHAVYDQLAALSPRSEAQRFAQSSALSVLTQVIETRFQLFVHDASIPTAMLVVLTSWLVVLFCGYALIAPRNPTALGVLVVCAVCLSGAVLLMLELAQPFDGLLRVSSHPLREALSRIGR